MIRNSSFSLRLTLEIQRQRFAKHFDFKLEIELEFCKIIQFHHQSQDSHQPRIGRLKDTAMTALFKHFAYKWDDDNQALGVVAFQQQVLFIMCWCHDTRDKFSPWTYLECNMLVQNRLVLCQCHSAKPGAQILQQGSLG